jgi:hypothetical protein
MLCRKRVNMTEQQFWMLIASIDQDALVSQDDDAALEPLLEHLRDLTEPDLFDFDEILALKLYALDGEVYAHSAGESGKSGDGFVYMRCYVVASGREFYEDVLHNPERMPNSIELWCEGLLYVHVKAWSEVTGNSEEDWPHISTVSYETGSNQSQWQILNDDA